MSLYVLLKEAGLNEPRALQERSRRWRQGSGRLRFLLTRSSIQPIVDNLYHYSQDYPLNCGFGVKAAHTSGSSARAPRPTRHTEAKRQLCAQTMEVASNSQSWTNAPDALCEADVGGMHGLEGPAPLCCSPLLLFRVPRCLSSVVVRVVSSVMYSSS